MEYLIGHPLRQHLDLRAMPPAEALAILTQAAAALDAVHAQGILHRDVRASNILLLHDGRVKLTEFGLAGQPEDATVTLMGTLVGEPAYMAPEQLRGQAATPQSDLWALGVLLYEMLAGRPPFEGANFQMVAHQTIMGEPAPVPGVSDAAQAVLKRALEKDPASRYPSGMDMVQALQKALSSMKSLPAASAPTFQTKVVRTKTPPRFAWVGALLIVLALSTVLGYSFAHHAAPQTVYAADRTAAPKGLH